MADVFISYSHEDAEEVSSLARKIDALGYSTWWDRKLVAGTRYRQAILEQLHAAGVVLVIWSPASVQSHFVEDEAERARKANKLIPLRTLDLAVDQIPLGFGGYDVSLCADLDSVVRAIAARGIKPTYSTSESECNMFSFFGDTGNLLSGIESFPDCDEETGAPTRCLEAVSHHVSKDGYISIGAGKPYHSVPQDIIHPPRFSVQDDFMAGSIVSSRDGLRVSAKQPAKGNIVRVYTGPWDEGDRRPVDVHGSINLDGTNSCLILGTAIRSKINVRRSSVWQLPVGASILVKASTSNRLSRLVSCSAGLALEPAINQYGLIWQESFTRVTNGNPNRS